MTHKRKIEQQSSPKEGNSSNSRKKEATRDIYPLSADFPFLNRDNKDKTYEPGKDGPFISSASARSMLPGWWGVS